MKRTEKAIAGIAILFFTLLSCWVTGCHRPSCPPDAFECPDPFPDPGGDNEE